MEREHGRLDAELVLEAARDPKSPLHKGFEWNDTKAAEKYRLEQARLILRSVRFVVTEDADGEVQELRRVFVGVQDEETRYASIEVIRGDDALYQQLLESAIKYLKGARDRFNEIKELAAIWEAIDAL